MKDVIVQILSKALINYEDLLKEAQLLQEICRQKIWQSLRRFWKRRHLIMLYQQK
ncbi:unnamed protein product [Paramecium primaurelia]|uniref:Uncharacterized protein n=1 Tax=Paramecium primaurelia TaxID=5886 RepID=A0A8S1K281_PARPR|nr:unnamed protein product [Paramecium primaurelia]